MKISGEVSRCLDVLRGHRRALHQIPEIATREYKTQWYITDTLAKLNPDTLETVADTGVRAVFLSGSNLPTLAFRADMDALPINEPDDRPYRSQEKGMMHACGHDGHVACLLTLAHIVAQRKAAGTLAVNVVLLFQPAEESFGGARRIIDGGGLDNPHVDAVFGLHVVPHVTAGTIALRNGPMMAEALEFDIELRGLSAHGATPQKGVDCVAAAAHLYGLLQTLLKRTIDPFEQALLTVGKLEAGTRRNVIAESAVMECIARAFTDDAFTAIRTCIDRAMAATEVAFGVSAAFIEREHFLSIHNPKGLYGYFQGLIGDDIIDQPPTMMAEDFSFYQRARPGLFFFLGVGDENHTSLLHTPGFDFDESALLHGVEAFIKILDNPPSGSDFTI